MSTLFQYHLFYNVQFFYISNQPISVLLHTYTWSTTEHAHSKSGWTTRLVEQNENVLLRTKALSNMIQKLDQKNTRKKNIHQPTYPSVARIAAIAAFVVSVLTTTVGKLVSKVKLKQCSISMNELARKSNIIGI